MAIQCLVLAALLISRRQSLALAFPFDDAFYYFQIARNFADGRGATFDGIHPTNGFHPLWAIVCAGVAALVTDPDAYVAAILVCGGLLHVGSTILFLLLLHRHLGEFTRGLVNRCVNEIRRQPLRRSSLLSRR